MAMASVTTSAIDNSGVERHILKLRRSSVNMEPLTRTTRFAFSPIRLDFPSAPADSRAAAKVQTRHAADALA